MNPTCIRTAVVAGLVLLLIVHVGLVPPHVAAQVPVQPTRPTITPPPRPTLTPTPSPTPSPTGIPPAATPTPAPEPPPVVPEPPTLMLLSSALAGIGGYVALQLRARRPG